MKYAVIGPGRWGGFISWYLDKIGKDVVLYGIKGSKDIENLIKTRKNEYLEFREGFQFTTNIEDVLKRDVIVISINSQNLRDLSKQLKTYNPEGKIFILCMKGIENTTGKRLTQVIGEYLGDKNDILIWAGPGHVQEFRRDVPNCMVIDGENNILKRKMIKELSSYLIRFYEGDDLIGNEIGAATKNIIGIAAGLLDGYEISSLKGALMSRGTKEISRLIKALGGNPLSAYGLCHLGDYEATVFSKHSNNRAFGEKMAKGQKEEKLAEGYFTTKAIKKIMDEKNIDLPICEEVYKILYENKEPKKSLEDLFLRDLKTEIEGKLI